MITIDAGTAFMLIGLGLLLGVVFCMPTIEDEEE